ncbi:MAG: DUF481 domain-containing protein [Verrucomicrobiales bacterium]|nr:DUF481 domain-containing protein [Verrucomicrobiales bacterium]MCP5527166.1 DUF481 domain-containing protein [Verrucomicrobiales bacterium]
MTRHIHLASPASEVLVLVVALAGMASVWAAEGMPPPPPPPSAPMPRTDGFDWMQFKNGEWLKGDIKELQDRSFTFESDELDTLQLDWEDINALYSPGLNTLMFQDRSSAEGSLRIEGDRVIVTTAAGEQTYSRTALRTIIPGRRTEWNYWSGKLSLGATVRRGNVNQTDISGFFRIQRRSPATRLRLDYNGVYGEVDRAATANNHRALLIADVYLTPQLYLRPLSFELYRDKFQNIDHRLTPAAGVGYYVLDRSGLEWSVFGGAGYQYTTFWEVMPGEDAHEGTAAVIGGSEFEWEATSKIDVGMRYNLTLPVPETETYNHHVEAYVSFDLWKDLDFDVRLTWDRINAPATGSDGSEPKPDDVRLYVGLGWEF